MHMCYCIYIYLFIYSHSHWMLLGRCESSIVIEVMVDIFSIVLELMWGVFWPTSRWRGTRNRRNPHD